MRCSIIWGAPFLMNLHPRNKVCRTYAFNSLPNKESSKTLFLSRRFGFCCFSMASARACLNSHISFKCAAEAVLEEEPLFTVDSTLTVSVVVGRLSFFGTASGGPTSMTLSSSPLLSSPVFAVFLFFPPLRFTTWPLPFFCPCRVPRGKRFMPVALSLRVYDFQFYEHTLEWFHLVSHAVPILFHVLICIHVYSIYILNTHYGEVPYRHAFASSIYTYIPLNTILISTFVAIPKCRIFEI